MTRTRLTEAQRDALTIARDRVRAGGMPVIHRRELHHRTWRALVAYGWVEMDTWGWCWMTPEGWRALRDHAHAGHEPCDDWIMDE